MFILSKFLLNAAWNYTIETTLVLIYEYKYPPVLGIKTEMSIGIETDVVYSCSLWWSVGEVEKFGCSSAKYISGTLAVAVGSLLHNFEVTLVNSIGNTAPICPGY